MNILKSMSLVTAVVGINAFSQSPNWTSSAKASMVAIGTVRTQSFKVQGVDHKTTRFDSKGSGVLVEMGHGPNKGLWIATAKHVIFQASRNWKPDTVFLRMGFKDSLAISDYHGIPFPLYNGEIPTWIPGELDIACLPVTKSMFGSDSLRIIPIPLEGELCNNSFYQGQPAFVYGYPGVVTSNPFLVPFLRTCRIGWVSPVEPLANILYLDCNLSQGNSGSPVFCQPEGPTSINPAGSFIGIITETTSDLNEVITSQGIVNDSNGNILYSRTYSGIGLVLSRFRIYFTLLMSGSTN